MKNYTHTKEKMVMSASLGLTKKEYKQICKLIDREPNALELGIFSAMWNEHCSYKSSRNILKKLPTKAPWVIQGPGENAGIVDIGDGLAAVFKMESHNHPSYIEPYQGAATAVGGILRDIFTMGARPIANLNCLRFGDPKHLKTRHLLNGVVAGIGDYGNCVGIPTVGGECTFDKTYNQNIIVNAMTVGITSINKIFYAKSGEPGSLVVYVGSKTGKDGIHGASMASEAFNKDSEEKRPTVQVGNPFTEKLLLEACLELMDLNVIVGIQDMGAAGLTSSSVEMASKDNLGMKLYLNKIPLREKSMTAIDIMLSESQERMLIITKPGSEKITKSVFDKWELDTAIIGEITDTKLLEIEYNGIEAASIPINPLAKGISYDRSFLSSKSKKIKKIEPYKDTQKALLKLLRSPDISSKKWIWEQYDSMVMCDTISEPGSNAAVMRVHGSQKCLAITTDCTPRYCLNDPYLGAQQAVAESYRNLISVGAKPLAITDCLNFGNPENKLVMGQFRSAIEGISKACKKLSMPVVSGNVSFYNESEGKNIPPTPQIGAIGIIKDIKQVTSIKPNHQDLLLLVGKTSGYLSCSLYSKVILNNKNMHNLGTPPPVNLYNEKKIGKIILELINAEQVSSCHDISDGGLIVSLSEMCLASNIGFTFTEKNNSHAFLFGEDQGRYLISCEPGLYNKNKEYFKKNKIFIQLLGTFNKQNHIPELTLPNGKTILVNKLRKAHEEWLPNYMENKR